jgi:hypothetical protein
MVVLLMAFCLTAALLEQAALAAHGRRHRGRVAGI